MAYDLLTAERIRHLLADRADAHEKKMMGGIAFMVKGGMACAASSRDGMLVRVVPQDQLHIGALTPDPACCGRRRRGRPDVIGRDKHCVGAQRQDGGQQVALNATLGRKDFEADTHEGRLYIRANDFLVRAADLVLGGQPTLQLLEIRHSAAGEFSLDGKNWLRALARSVLNSRSSTKRVQRHPRAYRLPR